MKYIPLTQGRVTVVDDEDYPALSAYKWYYKAGYAARNVGPSGHQSTIFMHSQITEAVDTDHIDRDGLNNSRSNLRITTRRVQAFNRSMPKRSLPRGVYAHGKRFVAAMNSQGRRIHLGVFDDPTAASHAYREKAFEIFGEYPPE